MLSMYSLILVLEKFNTEKKLLYFDLSNEAHKESPFNLQWLESTPTYDFFM